MIELEKREGYYWPCGKTTIGKKSLETHVACSLKRTRSLRYILEQEKWKDRRNLVVQAGGSYGVWPKQLAETFKCVLSFEPERSSFSLLYLNCGDIENIHIINAALTDETKFVHIHPISFTSHITTYEGSLKNIVCGVTIDSLNLPYCDMILLDVEGHEINALKGALKTIKKFKPIILVESKIIDDKVQFVLDLGYHVDAFRELDCILEYGV